MRYVKTLLFVVAFCFCLSSFCAFADEPIVSETSAPLFVPDSATNADQPVSDVTLQQPPVYMIDGPLIDYNAMADAVVDRMAQEPAPLSFVVGDGQPYISIGSRRIYLPVRDDLFFNVDSSGYLYNAGGSSFTGYESSGREVRFPVMEPAYIRISSGDREYIPVDANVSTSVSVKYLPQNPITGTSKYIPFLIILLLGGSFLCLLKKS